MIARLPVDSWTQHRADFLLAAVTAIFTAFFAFAVHPWAPADVAVGMLKVFFFSSLVFAWAVPVMRLFGVLFHRITMALVMTVLTSIFVMSLSLIVSGN